MPKIVRAPVFEALCRSHLDELEASLDALLVSAALTAVAEGRADELEHAILDAYEAELREREELCARCYPPGLKHCRAKRERFLERRSTSSKGAT